MKERIMATIQKDLHNQASNFGEQAKGTASDVASKAKDIGATATQKASEAASYVGKKADDATGAVGAGMKSVAQTIRENTPDKGMLGSATSAVADTLEQGGRYLQEQGLSGIGTDMTNLIRRNPIPAVLVGIGVGFLLARALTSSRS
jgi:hypothetical protein